MKRSNKVMLTVAGMSLALAGCESPPKADAYSFESEEQCKANASANWWTEEDCADMIERAKEQHKQTAPRYDSKTVCEEVHGRGACGGDENSNSSSSGGTGDVFMPFMMGYMMSSMMSGPSGNVTNNYSQPIYRSKGGGYTTGNGTTSFKSLGTVKSVRQSNITKSAPKTLGKAPMTRSTAMKSGRVGGFGGGRGGFGG